MKKMNLLQRMMDLGGLEEEGIPGQTVVELLGDGRALIEQYGRIVEYDLNRVCICVSFGTVVIVGSNLRLRAMTAGKLLITGNIDRIDINRRKSI